MMSVSLLSNLHQKHYYLPLYIITKFSSAMVDQSLVDHGIVYWGMKNRQHVLHVYFRRVWTLGSYPEKYLKNSYPRIESGRFCSYQTIVLIIEGGGGSHFTYDTLLSQWHVVVLEHNYAAQKQTTKVFQIHTTKYSPPQLDPPLILQICILSS